MNYTISGKNFQITDRIRNEVESSFSKIAKLFKGDVTANIVISSEKERKRVEATIPLKGGHTIRAEQESSDLFVSIDMVAEIIERQMKKYKGKLALHKRSAEVFSEDYLAVGDAGDSGLKISRQKRVDLKPMHPEDACIQMELLGHSFYVFRNADTEQINVVYRKKDSTFGLIEPE